MDSITILGILLATLSSVLIAHCIHRYHSKSRRDRRIEYHRQIADFSFLYPTTLEERLGLRSKPNVRLVTAFNINNSFTTSDRGVHQEFLKKAKDAIHLVHNTEDWIKLGNVTRKTLGFCLSHFNDGLPYIPLAPFVRVVSFNVVLHVLFKIEPSKVDLGEARKATDAINRLWIESKKPHSVPSLYDKKLLNNALEKLFPSGSLSDDGHSPLDLIMPAYETLWRVVLLTFVSIASQNADPVTEEELQEAVQNVPQCFCRKSRVEMRALAIAKEGLRLYPPTKRIYRATSTIDGESGVIAADVSACHRDRRVWGTNALKFKPRRFHNWPRENKRLSYFPFGVGRHICPAAAEYGDKIIVLLVVELTRRFGTRQTGLKVHFGDSEVQQRVSTPLPSGRDDMENWVLELEEET
ncbi:cytochrome P450 [Nemania abortiva]|nr:cytochrome P450 [Nemania abortiva]